MTDNNISSDSKISTWVLWLIADFQEKTGYHVRKTEVNNTNDGKLEITFKDKDDNILIIYNIDPNTGEGTDSANEKVSLPQTGNNSMKNMIIVLVALMMIGLGMMAIMLSGVYVCHRKKE